MTGTRRRARRWLGAAGLVAAVCAAGVGGSFGESSASPASMLAARQAQADIASRSHSKRVPEPKSLTSGVVGLATAARDGQAKVNLQVPAVVAAAYLDPAYRTPASHLVRVPSYYLPKHPKAGCTYKEGVIYSDLYAVTIRQPNPRKNGVVTSVGRFPDAHVSALGFGAVPITATLHTKQVKRHGKLVPLTANTITSFTSLPTRSSGEACDPSWDSGAQTPPLGTISHATLAVRISDVRVDRQPVDVGPSCHTESPLKLNLFGSDGYILYAGGNLIERYDPTVVHSGGNTYPVHPGSSNLTIPPFVGCVNPATGEDLSRLVTAMVSGDRNTVAVHQSTAVINGFGNKHVSKCRQGQGCVKLPRFIKPPRPGMTVHRRHH